MIPRGKKPARNLPLFDLPRNPTPDNNGPQIDRRQSAASQAACHQGRVLSYNRQMTVSQSAEETVFKAHLSKKLLNVDILRLTPWTTRHQTQGERRAKSIIDIYKYVIQNAVIWRGNVRWRRFEETIRATIDNIVSEDAFSRLSVCTQRRLYSIQRCYGKTRFCGYYVDAYGRYCSIKLLGKNIFCKHHRRVRRRLQTILAKINNLPRVLWGIVFMYCSY